MKKASLVLFILAAATCFSKAQVKGGDEKFQKLFDLYVMERYEDCAFKAENFTLNDKYRRSPEPYLYISLCYLKLYQDPDKQEEYPKALKESIKYAYKFRSKDKYQVKKGIREVSLFSQNIHFLNQLKQSGMAQGQGYIDEENYRKAASIYKSINKFMPEDDNVLFMKGVCDILSRNVGEGNLAINASVKNLREKRQNPDFEPDRISEPLLVLAFELYSDYLYNSEQLDSAKATITLARDFMPDDKEIRNQYNKLHGLEITEEEKEETKESRTYKLHYSEGYEEKMKAKEEKENR